MRLRSLMARAGVVLAVLLALVVAWRMGGGADEASARPRSGGGPRLALDPLRAASPSPDLAYEITHRLVELLQDARIESAAHSARLLAANGPATRPAWSPPGGATERFQTTIALRTSALATAGSHERRDAIVATPPSTFAFRVVVPAAAKLTFAEGAVNEARDATVFVVTVVDAMGRTHETYRRRLAPLDARRWHEASCSLEAFGGQAIELRLATETTPSTLEEREAAAERSKSTLEMPGDAVALWGSPTIVARTIPRLPYNVLWIAVDGLRPDVLASFHDDTEDAQRRSAESPPLEGLLPKVVGLTPVLDDLTKRGVRFTHAYSAGSWMLPGTLAMFSGARSSELGLDSQSGVPIPPIVGAFYASDPPLLPLIARRHGASAHAFGSNALMFGGAPLGVEMGFEHAVAHRDTLEITRAATLFVARRKDTRFFLFVNYSSPLEPYDPPPQFAARVPAPPVGPAAAVARLYMAEAARHDEAIGVLLRSVADAGLSERTIVVVTAAHGKTLSSAHAGIDGAPLRARHAASNYEETARIPVVIVAPGLLPAGRTVKDRIRNVNLAPTVTELLGLEAQTRFSGRSLVPLARGEREAEERVVVTEGRGTRAILFGRHRLLVREGAARSTIRAGATGTASEQLFDLEADPGERRDRAPTEPARSRRLDARPPRRRARQRSGRWLRRRDRRRGASSPIHLRFASGGRARRVSGSLLVGDASAKARSFTVAPIELGRDALTIVGEKVELAFTTSPRVVVGFDVVVDPPTTPLHWDLYLDDAAWPVDAVFGGPYGLPAPQLRNGLRTDAARDAAGAALLPPLDPQRDVGVFVVRQRAPARPPSTL